MKPDERARRVKQLARDVGFDLARITSALPLQEERDRYLRWLDAGRHGEMGWMTEDRARRSSDPSSIFPDARSVICVGLAYWSGHRPAGDAMSGMIARYAWGRDYHSQVGERLRSLACRLETELGGEYRCHVDTGPVMDKALAARAGIGWYGKNSNVLTEGFGSYVLLGEILTSLDLPTDRPITQSCGSCRLCVVACPTGAIGPEYSVDSTKCISYLTIEHRGPIPRDLRPLMGAWVFGCDICQDVCPPTMAHYLQPEERAGWARQVRSRIGGSPPAPEAFCSSPQTVPGHALFNEMVRPTVNLLWLLRLQHAEYVEAFRGSAIKRAKVWMLRRNAAIALGNVGEEWAVQSLSEAVCLDEEPIVRSHAAWALGRITRRLGSTAAGNALIAAMETETDPIVREEIELALATSPRTASVASSAAVEESDRSEPR